MTRCPNCLSDDLSNVCSISREPRGELAEEYFYRCRVCGSEFAESDTVEIPEIIVEVYEEKLEVPDHQLPQLSWREVEQKFVSKCGQLIERLKARPKARPKGISM